VTIEYSKARPGITVLTTQLREGKNREIRRVFAHLGLRVSSANIPFSELAQVRKLVRTGYGPYTLGDLKPGDFQEARLKGGLHKHVGPAWQWNKEEE
jgi:16S rRNA U516 pseudouridylate synthase RsuA-like enzyme